MKGGKTRGSFKKGHKGLKPKGAISAKTRAWEELGTFIAQDGAERYMNALKAMPDEKYVERFEHVLEYFKPKLARTEVTGKDGKDLPQPILTVNTVHALPANHSNRENPQLGQPNPSGPGGQ